jgi:hypothetical protein
VAKAALNQVGTCSGQLVFEVGQYLGTGRAG